MPFNIHISFANIVIEGEYSGAAEEETMYTTAQFKKLQVVAFAAGEGTTGVAPEAIYADVNESVTIPVSRFLAKDGYTLSGWTDGTNIYRAGNKMTVTGDITLTAVFTENTESLNNMSLANTTVTWDFQKKNCTDMKKTFIQPNLKWMEAETEDMMNTSIESGFDLNSVENTEATSGNLSRRTNLWGRRGGLRGISLISRFAKKLGLPHKESVPAFFYEQNLVFTKS